MWTSQIRINSLIKINDRFDGNDDDDDADADDDDNDMIHDACFINFFGQRTLFNIGRINFAFGGKRSDEARKICSFYEFFYFSSNRTFPYGSKKISQSFIRGRHLAFNQQMAKKRTLERTVH